MDFEINWHKEIKPNQDKAIKTQEVSQQCSKIFFSQENFTVR